MPTEPRPRRRIVDEADGPAGRRTSTPQNLTAAERRALKARAHALDPVVLVGDAGLTDGVLAEVERALAAHALIKVRVAGDDRATRTAIGERIAASLGAAPVQAIGKLLVFWREKLEPKTPRPSRAAPKEARKVARKVFFNPAYKVSTRKRKTAESPPRTARVRKAGTRSAKKPFQGR